MRNLFEDLSSTNPTTRGFAQLFIILVVCGGAALSVVGLWVWIIWAVIVGYIRTLRERRQSRLDAPRKPSDIASDHHFPA